MGRVGTGSKKLSTCRKHVDGFRRSVVAESQVEVDHIVASHSGVCTDQHVIHYRQQEHNRVGIT